MLKDLLRPLRFQAACLPWRLAAATGLYQSKGPPVRFVIENADWAIRWLGEHIRDEIEAIAPGTIAVTAEPRRFARSVVHFGSQYMWLTWGGHMSRTNRYVTSFFHGKREDGPEVSRHIDEFLDSVPRLARIVTGAGLIEQRLLEWGVPREKLVRIPIGVDTRLFRPPTAEQRHAARSKFGIAENAIVIGSFQKDGVGWGDGMEPKLIKGPDIFLKAVERMQREVPVVAMLTGPARGFVKQGLENLGIPFVHRYVQDHADLVECYHALDLYFVASREEGGPMGLMESMASGVPVVSTRVGMAPDLILDQTTGGLARPEDAEDIADKALGLLSLPKGVLAGLRSRAREAVQVCDWSVVGRRHFEEVYRPLLADAS
jgi:glycosyltransferase involved in cell wall biosynthesis